jgi:hypothetical protein
MSTSQIIDQFIAENGGIEAGILAAVAQDIADDRARLEYLESLPKGKWLTIDENRMAVLPEPQNTDQQ